MDHQVRRWLVDISKWNPSKDEFLFFVSLLPQNEHSAISRFIKFEDRKRAFISRLLQYSLVNEVLGIHFDKIIIDRTIEGKPYLLNNSSPLVLPFLVLSFRSMPTEQKYRGIINRYWSLKEAFVKALGAGLGYGLHRLEFHHNNWTNISVHIDGVKSTEWRFWLFKFDEMRWAAVAKGPPKDAAESFQKISPQLATEEDLNTVELHENPFTLLTWKI
ncbi:hypothetical protein J5N97_026139 [Dioscorea zingiberensis]|uniref:holo-[acyl-carrier-protein] synthase n=1 Tax=Dioscorea zingiberensis TaxID=325984 RepID=A0A9D5C1I8_9LILI|nr:hypothetical protein J5N97_026139 [Dioscorea zingiberensis]